MNRYLDDVANSVRPEPVSLDFWAKTNGELHQVTVDLVENGSLAPLFFAFNLMSEEEFLASRQSSSQTNQDLLDWLKATVEHALETADQHYALKTKISAVRAQMEEKYQLAEIQVDIQSSVNAPRYAQGGWIMFYCNFHGGLCEENPTHCCSSLGMCSLGRKLVSVNKSKSASLSPSASLVRG